MKSNSELKLNITENPLKVGILIYDDVYLLDFCGPLEIFNDTVLNDQSKAFQISLIAPTNNPIKAHTGTLIIPDLNIENAKELDILVIPGGKLDLIQSNKKIGEFINNSYKTCKLLMSVCTGAFIIAELGLLNNCTATTWYGAKEKLERLYPEINLVDERYSHCGKIITTAGISAGIDGALYIVDLLFGREIAINTANYIEWQSNSY